MGTGTLGDCGGRHGFMLAASSGLGVNTVTQQHHTGAGSEATCRPRPKLGVRIWAPKPMGRSTADNSMMAGHPGLFVNSWPALQQHRRPECYIQAAGPGRGAGSSYEHRTHDPSGHDRDSHKLLRHLGPGQPYSQTNENVPHINLQNQGATGPSPPPAAPPHPPFRQQRFHGPPAPGPDRPVYIAERTQAEQEQAQTLLSLQTSPQSAAQGTNSPDLVEPRESAVKDPHVRADSAEPDEPPRSPGGAARRAPLLRKGGVPKCKLAQRLLPESGKRRVNYGKGEARKAMLEAVSLCEALDEGWTVVLHSQGPRGAVFGAPDSSKAAAFCVRSKRDISEYYGIAWSTLQPRLIGKVDVGASLGRTARLPDDVERAMNRHLTWMLECGYGLSWDSIKECANALGRVCNVRNFEANDTWARRFGQLFPSLARACDRSSQTKSSPPGSPPGNRESPPPDALSVRSGDPHPNAALASFEPGVFSPGQLQLEGGMVRSTGRFGPDVVWHQAVIAQAGYGSPAAILAEQAGTGGLPLPPWAEGDLKGEAEEGGQSVELDFAPGASADVFQGIEAASVSSFFQAHAERMATIKPHTVPRQPSDGDDLLAQKRREEEWRVSSFLAGLGYLESAREKPTLKAVREFLQRNRAVVMPKLGPHAEDRSILDRDAAIATIAVAMNLSLQERGGLHWVNNA